MRLIAIPEGHEKFCVEGITPAEVSVRRVLWDGQLPGRKVGGTWHIDEKPLSLMAASWC